MNLMVSVNHLRYTLLLMLSVIDGNALSLKISNMQLSTSDVSSLITISDAERYRAKRIVEEALRLDKGISLAYVYGYNLEVVQPGSVVRYTYGNPKDASDQFRDVIRRYRQTDTALQKQMSLRIRYIVRYASRGFIEIALEQRMSLTADDLGYKILAMVSEELQQSYQVHSHRTYYSLKHSNRVSTQTQRSNTLSLDKYKRFRVHGMLFQCILPRICRSDFLSLESIVVPPIDDTVKPCTSRCTVEKLFQWYSYKMSQGRITIFTKNLYFASARE